MIQKLFNHPLVIYQTADSDADRPNPAIAAHIDNGGTICLEQERDTLCIDRGTVPDLIKALKQLQNVKVK